jgi:hypothetical protein
MKWFKHDTDASTDAKIKKLIIRHGADGYAIYFHCLELIAGNVSEHNINFELEHDAEIIADNLKIKGDADISAIDKVNMIMKTIIQLGLFECSNNKITCLKLAKRLDQSMTSNTKMRKMISNIKSHDTVMINHDTVMQEEKRTDKKRLDKKRIDKKKEKKTAHADYVKLTEKEYNKLLNTYGSFQTAKMIEKLNLYKASKGTTYKSDYMAIHSWVLKWYDENKAKLEKEASGDRAAKLDFEFEQKVKAAEQAFLNKKSKGVLNE